MAMNAFRKSVLDDIYDRVDNEAELGTLAESIKNGNAISIIEAKGGRLTTEDIDAIIAGERTEEDDDVVDMPKGMRGSEAGELNLQQPSVSADAPKAPGGAGSEAAPSATETSVDPEVERMVSEAMEAPEAEESGWFPKGLVAGNAANVAARLEDNKSNLRTNMSEVTREEWDGMSRDERKEAGLPVRPIDMWFAGKDAFKGAKTNEQVSKEILNTSDFIEVYFNDILDYFEEGEVDTTDKEDIKGAVASWFSDNAANLEVSGTIGTDSLTDIIHQAMNP
jgi:hypothetical protein